MVARPVGWTIAGFVAAVLSSACIAAQADAPAQAAGWRVFRDPGIGFTFEYPAGWTAIPGCHGSRRCVALSEGAAGVNDYTLALEGFSGGLTRTAADKSVFRQTARGWIAEGRSASHPARWIAGKGWRGLEAVVDCGVLEGGGVHTAAGDCFWAVLSNGRSSVVADTQAP